MKDRKTVVGVFANRTQAEQAVHALRQAGFRNDDIGVTGKNHDGDTQTSVARHPDADENSDSYSGEAGLAGLAAGAGIGGLWGLGILAGVLPVIGPAIAAGSLAVLLSSAAAGAAAAGLTGALIGLGIPKDEADYYESEVGSGRILVTVNAGERTVEAATVLRRAGGYDMANRRPTETVARASDTTVVDRSEAAATSHHEGYETNARSEQLQNIARDLVNNNDKQTVQAREEQLRVEKKNVRTGQATVRKEIHTEHKTFDVPVQREEIVIERRSAGSKGDAGSIQSTEEIRIPVSEEQVNVVKQTVAKEEVTVGKRQVPSVQHIDETVRKEEIKIDTQGKVDVRDERRS